MTNSITVKKYIEDPSVRERIQTMLKDRAPQFVVSLLSVVNSNEDLAKCEPNSVLTAAMTAASLNLPINNNLGYAYVIPYGGKAQLQLGYKAFIQLAQRSGQFKTINVSDVRAGEIVAIDRLTGDISFNWIKEEREKAVVIGYVGYMELVNGFRKSLYMTVAELKAHGMRFSQTMKSGYGLWKTDFDAMASKTVIKLLLAKYAPLTVEMQKATLADQSVVIGDDKYEYVDNQPQLAEDIAKEKENARVLKHIEESKTIDQLEVVKDHIDSEDAKNLYDLRYAELKIAEEKQ